MPTTTDHVLSRREVLRTLAWISAGVAGSACVPAELVFNASPAPHKRDPNIVEPILRLFVETVVPGTPVEHPGSARVFFDPFYPLTPHRAWLARDLNDRAMRQFRQPFDGLPRSSRGSIIQSGLSSRGLTGRVYHGAVFLAQVAVFAGLAHPTGACPAIGFQGPAGVLPLADQTYPEPGRYLGRAHGVHGNPT
jgi:hypothetical protein